MPRKQKNIHYLYKTTCLVTGRYYIGMHSTTNLEDGYMGSGKVLRRSIRKYGVENHMKEILEFFDSRELLVEAEKTAITSDMLIDRMCMNLVEGGDGWKIEHNQVFINRLNTDPEFRLAFSKKISDARKLEYQLGRRERVCPLNWSGRTHSEETKKKMVKIKENFGAGKMNSQFGTCWITNGVQSKKISSNEDIPIGWFLGRTVTNNNLKTKLTNDDILKIKENLKTNKTQKEIANIFGVAQETISKINRGLIWKSVT